MEENPLLASPRPTNYEKIACRGQGSVPLSLTLISYADDVDSMRKYHSNYHRVPKSTNKLTTPRPPFLTPILNCSPPMSPVASSTTSFFGRPKNGWGAGEKREKRERE